MNISNLIKNNEERLHVMSFDTLCPTPKSSLRALCFRQWQNCVVSVAVAMW